MKASSRVQIYVACCNCFVNVTDKTKHEDYNNKQIKTYRHYNNTVNPNISRYANLLLSTVTFYRFLVTRFIVGGLLWQGYLQVMC